MDEQSRLITKERYLEKKVWVVRGKSKWEGKLASTLSLS